MLKIKNYIDYDKICNLYFNILDKLVITYH